MCSSDLIVLLEEIVDNLMNENNGRLVSFGLVLTPGLP